MGCDPCVIWCKASALDCNFYLKDAFELHLSCHTAYFEKLDIKQGKDLLEHAIPWEVQVPYPKTHFNTVTHKNNNRRSGYSLFSCCQKILFAISKWQLN